jgi:hypothetical protein
MFSVILYTLRQTVGHRAPLWLFPSFFPSYCDVSQALSYFASTIPKLQKPRLGPRAHCDRIVITLYFVKHIKHTCRSQCPRGLRRLSWLRGYRGRGFESRWRHRCLSFCVVLSCTGRDLASGWSPVQGVVPNVELIHKFTSNSELI